VQGNAESAAGFMLAAAPISWGVCEVPGWGLQLDRERVLREMASLGLRATELGAIGYLPTDPRELRELLDRHGLRLVAGFVPVVLHEPSLDETRAHAERMARLLVAAGAEIFVAAAVLDMDWSAPRPLSDPEWERLATHLDEIGELAAGHGLELAIHPHVGTLIESAADVDRLLATSDAGWCFDSGHLFIGGCDPADFVRRHGDRIVHVHLKDVDAHVAARLRAGALTLVEATQEGLFRPLGQGDARIDEVVAALDDIGYGRWLVLEQDAAITGQEPPVGSGPLLDVRRSVEWLTTQAPEREVAQR
jgi:inosose dehydratase